MVVVCFQHRTIHIIESYLCKMKNKQPIPKGTELKTIPDYPSHKISICGKYIVSDKGKVITQAIQTIKGKPTGYIYATLCSPTYYKRIAVHRLVAFAWVPAPPSNKHTWINHKDRDKGNNPDLRLKYFVSGVVKTYNLHYVK